MTPPPPGSELEDHLAQVAADDPPRASGRCTVDLPGSLPRAGLLGVGSGRVWFLQQDPFGVAVAREWARADLGEPELREGLDGPRIVLRAPEGRVEASGFAAPDAAEQLWAALTAVEAPVVVIPEPVPEPAPLSPIRIGDEPFDGTSPTLDARRAVSVVIALVALGLMAMGGVFAYLLVAVPTPAPVPEVDAVVEVAETPAPPTAPTGLKGLRFGMTEDQVRSTMPEMQAAARGAAEGVTPDYDLSDLLDGSPSTFVSVTVPGDVWVVETSIGTDPASCELHFAVDGGLSRMRCQLDPLPSSSRHVTAETGLVTTLTERYGPPASKPGELDPVLEDAMGMRDRDWTWQDDEARLALSSSYFEVLKSSEIVLDNVSAGHDRLIEELEAKAARIRTERAAEERARREEEAAAARERLSDTVKALEDDL